MYVCALCKYVALGIVCMFHFDKDKIKKNTSEVKTSSMEGIKSSLSAVIKNYTECKYFILVNVNGLNSTVKEQEPIRLVYSAVFL